MPAVSASSNVRFLDPENLLTLILPLEGALSDCRLRAIRRSDDAVLEWPCQVQAGEIHCVIPRGQAPDVGRWDLWLQIGAKSEWQRARGYEDPQADRHFYCVPYGELRLSAYVTESESSLAFYVAPANAHRRQVTAENSKKAYQRYLQELPVQDDLVLFESFLGKAYAGNPRYIYEELLRSRPDLRCVWAYNGKNPIPGDPQVVTRGSDEYYCLLAQAKYRVNNVRFPVNGRKAETIYLQTWHGTPLKRLSYDIEVEGPETAARDSLYQESRGWSILLSENSYASQILPRAFRYSGPVLEAGYPLTDVLYDSAVDTASIQALGLPDGKRFILYAPTWRDNKAIAAWKHELDLNLDLAVIAAGLPSDFVLLIKAHHLISEKLDRESLPANVLDMSHIEDINDLCLVADVLVTDYSSVFFDFATTGRPMLFFCYDLEVYANELRGLYMDVHNELPGPVLRTTAELVRELADLDGMRLRYAERYEAFRHRYCALNDGQVTRRVVAEVFGHAG